MRSPSRGEVMLAVQDFEAIMNELENLRIEAVARNRLAAFDPQREITLNALVAQNLAASAEKRSG